MAGKCSISLIHFYLLEWGKTRKLFVGGFYIQAFIYFDHSVKKGLLQLSLSIHRACKYESLFCICLSVVIESICYHSVKVLNKEKVICYHQSFHIIKVFQKLHSLGFILKPIKNMNRPKRPCYYCGLLQSQQGTSKENTTMRISFSLPLMEGKRDTMK